MSYLKILVMALALSSCAFSGKDGERRRSSGGGGVLAFDSVGDRRVQLLENEMERLGCVFDEREVREARNGEVVTLRHKVDPRGDCRAVFCDVVLPKGRWAFYGLDAGRASTLWREAPEKRPRASEAVAVLLSGQSVSVTPRDLENDKPSRLLRVHLERVSGWDLKIAHHAHRSSSTLENSYYAPFASPGPDRQRTKNQIPFVNLRRQIAGGQEVIETLCWFERQGL